jgi:hypothetical protein
MVLRSQSRTGGSSRVYNEFPSRSAGTFPWLGAYPQSLELPHFTLRLSRLALFAVQSRQSEMRLRRQRTLFFDFH